MKSEENIFTSKKCCGLQKKSYLGFPFYVGIVAVRSRAILRWVAAAPMKIGLLSNYSFRIHRFQTVPA